MTTRRSKSKRSRGDGSANEGRISLNATPLYQMLLEAAVLPAWLVLRLSMPDSLEAAEQRDALAQNGMPWGRLLHDWSMDHGQMPLAASLGAHQPSGGRFTIDTTSFYEALDEISLLFPLEFSMPVRPRGESGPIDPQTWAGRDLPRMPRDAAREVQVTDRTPWMAINLAAEPLPFDLPSVERSKRGTPSRKEPPAAEPPPEVPAFGAASLELSSGEVAGETWVRLDPEHVRALLERGTAAILRTLAILGEGRLELLRDRLYEQQAGLDSTVVARVNEHIRAATTWHGTLEMTASRIEAEPDESKRAAIAAQALEILRSAASPEDELRDTLDPLSPGGIEGLPKASRESHGREAETRRFDIALSFPGEHRAFVERVARALGSSVGRDRVLYDSDYEAEFARADLDTYLQRLYHDESHLIAVFLCADYERKEWCGLEWRAVRDLIKRRQASAVMPLRFDTTEIPGLFSIDGYVWIGERTPEQVATVILERLAIVRGGGAPVRTEGSGQVGSLAMLPRADGPTPLVSIDRLPRSSGELLGRGAELQLLDEAWAETGRTHAVVLVAAGGVGKTALVKRWLERVKADGWRGAERVYAWSFYSQGTSDDRQASEDAFFDEALRWFEVAYGPSASAADKGRLLAQAVARQRTLLVLDGVEPLQHPPGPQGGRLRAPGLDALLNVLVSAGQPGMVLLTTREVLTDLEEHERSAEHIAGAVRRHDLGNLAPEDGARLLHRLGVQRAGGGRIGEDDGELLQLSGEVRGHALALTLMGRYLSQAHGGDVRKRDQVNFQAADAETQGGHAFRVMEAYEKWLGSGEESGRRALAVVRLLGLFDRPAEAGCLAALRREPAVAGLTEALVGLGEAQWNLALTRLVECRLVMPLSEGGAGAAAGMGDGQALDAHPLVREHFARRLRKERPEAWREGHRRLYEHLKESVPHRPNGLAGLQPLYQAVAHGCHAGLRQEACDEVYINRILRGMGADGFQSTKKLGAFSANLAAVSCFFEEPWGRLAPGLSETAQAWMLGVAGVSLRALGRLSESREPTRASLEMAVRLQDWKNAARGAHNVSELELTLGEVTAAVQDAEESVGFADHSEDAFMRMGNRSVLADALHQAGRRGEAMERFREAEAMQRERQPRYPFLYSLQGFRYYDLLLSDAERGASLRWLGFEPAAAVNPGQQNLAVEGEDLRTVEERASQTLAWVTSQNWLLDIALDHLALGRASLYRGILEGATPPEPRVPTSEGKDSAPTLATARQHLAAAVNGFRAAGYQDHLPRGLISRAWLHMLHVNAEDARADLDEAWRIAERGLMRLHMADILLHRARLFRDKPALAQARILVEQCGYHRRDGELADAEAAAQAWPDTPRQSTHRSSRPPQP